MLFDGSLPLICRNPAEFDQDRPVVQKDAYHFRNALMFPPPMPGGKSMEKEKIKKMLEDKIQIYCGTGSGRSAAAIGQGIRYACAGKNVMVVRFLKGREILKQDYLKRLEPELKVFSFDKFARCYNDLTEEEQQEENLHIRNGLNFSRKVLVTEECDVLILDEILDLVHMGIVSVEEVSELLRSVSDQTIVIMTGTHHCEELWQYATRITEVSTLKEPEE